MACGTGAPSDFQKKNWILLYLEQHSKSFQQQPWDIPHIQDSTSKMTPLICSKCSKVTNSSNFHRSYRVSIAFHHQVSVLDNSGEEYPRVQTSVRLAFQTEKLIRNPCRKKGLYSSTKVDSHSPSKATKNYLLIPGVTGFDGRFDWECGVFLKIP